MNRPLPDLQPIRVDDSKTQRAFDSISNTMREVLRFLQGYVQREPWQGLSFYSDWTAALATLQVPQARRYPWREVRLRGWAKTATGASATIAVLPQGWRPPKRISFTGFRNNGGYSLARIDVDVDGRVLLVTPAVGAGDELSLDGIAFDLEE